MQIEQKKEKKATKGKGAPANTVINSTASATATRAAAETKQSIDAPVGTASAPPTPSAEDPWVEPPPVVANTPSTRPKTNTRLPTKCGHVSGACKQLAAAMEPFQKLFSNKNFWTRLEYDNALAALTSHPELFVPKATSHVARDLVFHGVHRFSRTLLRQLALEIRESEAIPASALAGLLPIITTSTCVEAEIFYDMEAGKGLAGAVVGLIVAICEKPFGTDPTFLRNLELLLAHVIRASNDEIYHELTRRETGVSSLVILITASEPSGVALNIAAELLEYVIHNITDIGESSESDRNDLALVCLRDLSSRGSHEVVDGGPSQHKLLNAYNEYVKWQDVPVTHLGYLEDLVDGMLAVGRVRPSELVKFPDTLWRFHSAASTLGLGTNVFPGKARDKIIDLIEMVSNELRNQRDAFVVVYTLRVLCELVDYAERQPLEPELLFDSVPTIYRYNVILSKYGSTHMVHWLVHNSIAAAIAAKRHFRNLFQVLIQTGEYYADSRRAEIEYFNIWPRDDLWHAMDEVLSEDSNQRPHSSASLAIWRILAYLSQFANVRGVIIHHNFIRHAEIAFAYVHQRFNPRPSSDAPSHTDLNAFMRANLPSAAETSDFNQLFSSLSDVMISVLGHHRDLVQNYTFPTIPKLSSPSLEYMFALLHYSHPVTEPQLSLLKQTVSRSGLPIIPSSRLQSQDPNTGTFVPAALHASDMDDAHRCFALWNALWFMIRESVRYEQDTHQAEELHQKMLTIK